MITINVDPVLLHLGPVEIRWYGVMVALAVLAIVLISLKEAKRVHMSEIHVYNIAVWAVIGGVIGSRLFHVIDKWDYYFQHPEQIVGFAGVAVYGAVVGVIVAIAIYTVVKKLSMWQLCDVVSPGSLVGMAIGRIGCVLNGCCYGLPTDGNWGFTYTHPDALAPFGTSVQPTQLYHIIWNMLAFGLLWALRRKPMPRGSIFLLYVSLYSVGDLLIRFFREGEPFLFGIQQAQLIGITILVVTIPLFVIRLLRFRTSKVSAIETDTMHE